MRRIKYICYYNSQYGDKNKRNAVLSATNKLDYIFDALNRLGVAVDIISYSGCTENKWIKAKGGVYKHGPNTLRLFTSYGPYNISIVRVLSALQLKLRFIIYFLSNVKKREEVFIYHSLGYCGLLKWLKAIKKCKYIGEIEELYQDVSHKGYFTRKSELDFINCCDKYVFPTIFLNEKFNKAGKPYVIISGIYRSEPKMNVYFDDSKIHVVYAGTFDPNKGGAAAATAAAEFLPNNYHVHILGTGSNNEISNILNIINDIQKNKYVAEISYDGVLSGEAFTAFLQKCQIGLSSQNPNAKFNATSLPSKILSYMANGLEVVSVRIPVIEFSAIGKYMHYYEKQDPKEIAKAIMDVKINNTSSSREVLEELDSNFLHELCQLLHES